jgi:aerobic-type carbon monoxide dehydrogenase small subunit (CoxS/CutS family)
MDIQVNRKTVSIPVEWQGEMLLHVLREYLGLVGAKYGCGDGLCGACTVNVDGQAVRSCQTELSDVVGQAIETIEGLASESGELHPLQRAWLEEAVPQCGYCQAGQIMSAAALLRANPKPSDEQINQTLAGNLCRCGTHQRVRRAVKKAAGIA